MLERICGIDKNFNNWIKNWDKKRDKINGYSFISTFEKIILCRYLVKLIDYIDIDKNTFDYFYEKVICILNSPKKDYPKLTNNRDCKNELRFKDKLRPILITKLNTLKYKKSQIKNKINLISELYGLSEIEYEF